MTTPHKVTVIPGDGIGPEVIAAAMRIIEATGVKIEWEKCEAGAEVFKKGLATGVPPETIESIKRNRVALKGPLQTPIGYGEKSANVTLRKLFETFGNIRPVREFEGVPTPFSGRGINLVIVRENVEDLYAGIEYMQTPDVAMTLKLISQRGSEKIIRLAFEYARAEGRKRVHCATKANIMKFSEGALKRAFEAIAPEYPDIEAEHIIVDNCAHQMVRFPEKFDVIVTTNMNGDILSDLSSGLVGGLGFAPGANIGTDIAIFEAVHGSAPKYAGQNIINPTAVILSGVMMLRHLGEFAAAANIEEAVINTLREGIRTQDVSGEEGAVSTTAFTDAIIRHLGQLTPGWKSHKHTALKIPSFTPQQGFVSVKERTLRGVDVFIEFEGSPDQLGPGIEKLVAATPFQLRMISNRGVKVYPSTGVKPDTARFWCCRFMVKDPTNTHLTNSDIAALLAIISSQYSWMHVEKLQSFDGKDGFSKVQGED